MKVLPAYDGLLYLSILESMATSFIIYLVTLVNRERPTNSYRLDLN